MTKDFKLDELNMEEIKPHSEAKKGFKSYRMRLKGKKKEDDTIVENELRIFVHEDKSLFVLDTKTRQGIYLYKQQIKHLKEIIKDID